MGKSFRDGEFQGGCGDGRAIEVKKKRKEKGVGSVAISFAG